MRKARVTIQVTGEIDMEAEGRDLIEAAAKALAEVKDQIACNMCPVDVQVVRVEEAIW